MSSESVERLLIKAKSGISEYIPFMRIAIANEMNLREKNIKLTYREVLSAGTLAARKAIPFSEDKLINLLAECPEIMSHIVSERGRCSVKVIIESAFVELLTLKMRSDLLKVHEKQYDGYETTNLLNRANEILDALIRTSPQQSLRNPYVETYDGIVNLYVAKKDECSLRKLAQISTAYIERLKFVNEHELARRVEEEMDYVLGHTEKFLTPAPALEMT